MTSKCPYCGVAVPSNCITCPKCYRPLRGDTSDYKIVDEPEVVKTSEKKSEKNQSVLKFLTMVPPIFGLLGLGQIYNNYKDSKGYYFLLAGIVLYAGLMFMFDMLRDSGFFSGIFLFITVGIIALIYISAAIGAYIDARFGSVFRVLKF